MRNIEDLVELPLDHGGGGGHGDGGDDAGVEVVVERHHQGLGARVQVQLEQSVVIISLIRSILLYSVHLEAIDDAEEDIGHDGGNGGYEASLH